MEHAALPDTQAHVHVAPLRHSEFQQLLSLALKSAPPCSPGIDAHLKRVDDGDLGSMFAGRSDHDLLFSNYAGVKDAQAQVRGPS